MSNNDQIQRLSFVDLRGLWESESSDFTPWLAQNIDFLNEALGIKLSFTKSEVSAGPFYADILAEDESGNRWVIENQLEKTDHNHLG